MIKKLLGSIGYIMETHMDKLSNDSILSLRMNGPHLIVIEEVWFIYSVFVIEANLQLFRAFVIYMVSIDTWRSPDPAPPTPPRIPPPPTPARTPSLE